MALPRDFRHAPVGEGDRVLAYCGQCRFFEVWTLGGGGDCHKHHDTIARARNEDCPDRSPVATSEGPHFDMSE